MVTDLLVRSNFNRELFGSVRLRENVAVQVRIGSKILGLIVILFELL